MAIVDIGRRCESFIDARRGGRISAGLDDINEMSWTASPADRLVSSHDLDARSNWFGPTVG